MSSRKSPPPAINTQQQQQQQQDKGKSRARPPPSRTPSRAHSTHPDQNGSDDEPPTSTLRARNVTGSSMREFPPSPGAGSETPKSGSQTPGGMAPGSWRLPGVKGTMGGIASPGRSQFPTSPALPSAIPSAICRNFESQNGETPPRRPPATFRTDPTIKSCLDTLPLESKDEIKRLFGVA